MVSGNFALAKLIVLMAPVICLLDGHSEKANGQASRSPLIALGTDVVPIGGSSSQLTSFRQLGNDGTRNQVASNF